jgi:hypothetical protein
MLRASKISLGSPDPHISSRGRHKLVPSVGGAATPLEDRALLSGMGHIVAVHHLSQSPPPNSSVGPIVVGSGTSSTPHLHHRAPHGVVVFVGRPRPMPLAVHPSLPRSPPPNSSVGPIVVGSSTGATSSPDPILPIIWRGPYSTNTPSSQSPPPNSSVGPIVV